MSINADSFRVPGGSWKLFPLQVDALNTLATHRCGFFSMGVGAGKTLTAMLAARALDIDPDRVLVLTTARLREEAAVEFERYREHWDVPDVEYASYDWISRNEKYFWEKSPLLIVADEAHLLGNPRANRTHAFLRYMRENPEVIFVPMSGTLTRSSIMEYAHLMRMALRDKCPLPAKHFQLESLARVFDSRPQIPPDGMDFAAARKFVGGTSREDLFRLFQTTPGVVVSEETAYAGPLEVKPWKYGLPAGLRNAMKKVETELTLPNGMIVEDALGQAEKQKQLAQGFYYYPVYLDCHTPAWKAARRDKNELIQETIKLERRKKHGLITTARVEAAFAIGVFKHHYWEQWVQFREVPEPETAVVWLDKTVIEAAIERALAHSTPEYGALLWYDHECVRFMLDELSAFHQYMFVTPLGEAPPRGKAREGISVAAVSLRSHATGLNLQHDYAYNLVLAPPSNGGLWEQMVGRTHRNGQVHKVVVEYNASTKQFRDALYKAKKDAKYVEETWGQQQKLLM